MTTTPMNMNPKQIIDEDGSISYYWGDLLHNPNGPAYIGPTGEHTEYWIKGLRHRVDGPAIELPNGDYEYYVMGKRHNLNGPAVCYGDLLEYWIDGYHCANEEEYIMKLFQLGIVNGKKLS